MTLDQLSVRPGQSARANMVVAVSAGDTGEVVSRVPLTVLFVLDASASMKGPPLEHVIASVDRIVNLLSPQDRVGIAAFANKAEELLSLRAVTPEAKRSIQSAIHSLEA